MPVQEDRKMVTRDRAGHDYRTLLVHAGPSLASTHRVELAASLARRFQARLIGLGAENCEPVAAVDPYAGQLVGEVYEQMMRQVDADLKAAEAAFLRDAAGGDIEWRVERTTPGVAMARAARAADLIITTTDEARGRDLYVALDPVDIILTSGRPVLVAPSGDGHLSAEKIVVAWKDTREARRAVADAMPFLVRAQDVRVQSICEPDEAGYAQTSADDVAAALRRHGVPARGEVRVASDAAVAVELNAAADDLGADLIVTGAYGHSRVLEWALGGVTRSLLQKPKRYLLLSH